MDFWIATTLQYVTAGRWLRAPSAKYANFALAGVSIDSRSITAGQVFVAIKGDRFDGHAFLSQAVANGAALLIVSDEKAAAELVEDQNAPAVLVVDDTLATLQNLAHSYRDVLASAGCKIISVSGSNGKTTTRNLIHAVLETSLRGSQSPKSFNNHIGVPLTLLAAKTDDAFVVVEVGTNHPGEVDALGALVRPDIAVITSLGREHLEYLGDIDGVAEEEAAILKYVQPGGLAVHYGEWNALPIGALPKRFLEMLPINVADVRLGQEDDCHLSARFPHNQVHLPQYFEVFTKNECKRVAPAEAKPFDAKVYLMGSHNVANALAAVAVGRWFGVGEGQIIEGLAGVRPVPGRMEPRRIGTPDAGIVLIDDAYNSNPESAIQAAATLASCQRAEPEPPRRVLILGDMFELGEQSPSLHQQVGRQVATFNAGDAAADAAVIHLVMLIGSSSCQYTSQPLLEHWAHSRVLRFENWTDTLPETIADLLDPGDVVLMKASRGMRLERLIPAIEERFGHTSSNTAG